ncbi:MAG: helix-turn-helix domain-containing protein [Clostridia bacterium]|nr:helix-turn-helix domain-containing protein [Clostridia bacterium]
MSIGTTIKRLRREKDITQEQLAEYLGITSRAVSQWECDRTSPDISQIPALCHIFDITSDTLLGIDIEKTNEQIAKYLNDAKNVLYEGKFEDNLEILREANCKFPKSYEIMYELSDAIISVHSRKGIKDYEEVFSLCNRILDECTDTHLRFKAIDSLALAYDYAGKKDEMMKLTEQMPRVNHTYERFMLYNWEGDKGYEEMQEYLDFSVYQVLVLLRRLSYAKHDNGKFIYSLDERKKLWQMVIDLLDLIYPDGDYCSRAQDGNQACSSFVGAYLKEKDYDKFFYWLEKGIDFAVHTDTYGGDDAKYTSLPFRGRPAGGLIPEADGNYSQCMLEWITTDKDLDALRSDPRYDAAVNRLKEYAFKP